MWEELNSVLKSCCKFLPQHPKTAIAELFWIKCKTAVVRGRIALKSSNPGAQKPHLSFCLKRKENLATQHSCCKWNLSKKKSLEVYCYVELDLILHAYSQILALEDPQLCTYMSGECSPNWGRQSGLLPVICRQLLLQSWLAACLPACLQLSWLLWWTASKMLF